MSRQTYNTDVVSQILAAKLCTKTYLLSLLEKFLL